MEKNVSKDRVTKSSEMKLLAVGSFLVLIVAIVASHIQVPFLYSAEITVNEIPPEVRLYWMKQANEALYNYSGPCPFRAFGTVIVNHTEGRNEIVCSGANNVSNSGDPTQHGEINGIQRCARILAGRGLSPAEISGAMRQLSLYTNAEPCPMCASAIRQAGFREYIYGTSIDHLFKAGWGQILISSQEVVAQSWPLGTAVKILGSIGTEFTNPLFEWQYQEKFSCPKGCKRTTGTPGTTTCIKIA